MKDRFEVRVGVKCDSCHQDCWIAYDGHNRCRCGQRLWVERSGDSRAETRFRYRQGRELPKGYRGWLEITR